MSSYRLVLTGICIICHALTSAASIWPQPIEFNSGSEVLWIDNTVHTSFRCENELNFELISKRDINDIERLGRVAMNSWNQIMIGLSSTSSDHDSSQLLESSVLKDAIQDAWKSIHHTKFVPWKLHKRHSNFEPDLETSRKLLSSLTIIQKKCPKQDSIDPKVLNEDESYEINIENYNATIKSNSTVGTLRALESFKQLVYAHSSKIGSYIPHSPIYIFDRPKWSHRGISLDIARNPIDPETVLKVIEGMVTTKLNRLHIHATDSQSWPIEIPSLPDLAAKGAYQPHLVWTVDDLKRVQQFAIRKGISAFIEIDIPGHTASIAHAYPDLIAAFNELDWSTFAAEPLSGQLKLKSQLVRDFIDTLFKDLIPRFKPFTNFYHSGGDEVNLPAYLLDETVRSSDVDVLRPLLQSLFDQVFKHMLDANIQPIVWEEMILDWDLSLPSIRNKTNNLDTLVQVWISSEHIQKVLEKGYRVIFGSHEYWYLDCGFGNFLDPYPTGSSPPGIPVNSSGGKPSVLKPPYLDYCNPYHNWRHIYMYDPLVNISTNLQSHIEGGEVLMWSEQTDAIDLGFKLWPRSAAAAEVLWSGVRNSGMLEDASRRLTEWRERVVIDDQLQSSPVHMTWCTMEGGCLL